MINGAASGYVLTSDSTGNGTWKAPVPTYTIGLYPELGGYVFRISADGKHGLVAETVDQVSGSPWYAAQDVISNPANHSTNGQIFMDWRLPTKFELAEMYAHNSGILNFSGNLYWSSTEDDSTDAWRQSMVNGAQDAIGKTAYNALRSVRAF